MPPKNKYKKKTYSNYKKKFNKKSKLGKPSKGIVTSEYKFRRQKQFHYNLGMDLSAAGWNLCTDVDFCIYKTWEFNAAADVTAWTDFSQLFQSYKLDSARIQVYPDTNTITTLRQAPQMCMITIPTRTGYVPSTWAALQNHQAMKKEILFRQDQPIDMYMKLNQQSMIYSSNSTGNPQYTDYVKTKPKFIATEEGNAMHYGFTTYIFTINQTPMDGTGSWNQVALNIWQTIYFTCKGVA